MKEKVVTFGEGNQLVGIITEPEEHVKIEGAPAILILNSGMHHHVGPFRLNVVTARCLADCGYTVLRFDVSGMGDSRSRKDSEYDADRTIVDIGFAMDEMSGRKGISEFVLMGLCTGANNAHRAAVADNRVKGGIFLSGYAYPTWYFYIKRYGPIALSPRRAMHMVQRLGRRLFEKAEAGNKRDGISGGFHWWVLPPKDETRQDLVTLVDRGVNLLYVYSEAERRRYNYSKQMEHSFPSIDFRGRLKILINKDAHHAYLMTTDREKLMRQVTEWLNECYGEQ